MLVPEQHSDGISSLSARRAWIEIFVIKSIAIWDASLSARRAWIEIAWHIQTVTSYLVALRKESGGRNAFRRFDKMIRQGRSPQGERG